MLRRLIWADQNHACISCTLSSLNLHTYLQSPLVSSKITSYWGVYTVHCVVLVSRIPGAVGIGLSHCVSLLSIAVFSQCRWDTVKIMKIIYQRRMCCLKRCIIFLDKNCNYSKVLGMGLRKGCTFLHEQTFVKNKPSSKILQYLVSVDGSQSKSWTLFIDIISVNTSDWVMSVAHGGWEYDNVCTYDVIATVVGWWSGSSHNWWKTHLLLINTLGDDDTLRLNWVPRTCSNLDLNSSHFFVWFIFSKPKYLTSLTQRAFDLLS